MIEFLGVLSETGQKIEPLGRAGIPDFTHLNGFESGNENLLLEDSRTEQFLSQLEPMTSASLVKIEQMESLWKDNWERSSFEDRLEACVELEQNMAELQGRPVCEVIPREMGSLDNCGAYSDGKIYVNVAHLTSPEFRLEVLDTIVHEGRHAYQEWAVKKFADSPNLVERFFIDRTNWEDNLENYIDFKLDPRGYWNQPVEVDARNYAEQVLNTVKDSDPSMSFAKSSLEGGEHDPLFSRTRELLGDLIDQNPAVIKAALRAGAKAIKNI